MLICLSVEYVERVLKVDDPVGAISVHGACGAVGSIVSRLVRRRDE
jgi:Amt family ammonium transporter